MAHQPPSPRQPGQESDSEDSEDDDDNGITGFVFGNVNRRGKLEPDAYDPDVREDLDDVGSSAYDATEARSGLGVSQQDEAAAAADRAFKMPIDRELDGFSDEEGRAATTAARAQQQQQQQAAGARGQATMADKVLSRAAGAGGRDSDDGDDYDFDEPSDGEATLEFTSSSSAAAAAGSGAGAESDTSMASDEEAGGGSGGAVSQEQTDALASLGADLESELTEELAQTASAQAKDGPGETEIHDLVDMFYRKPGAATRAERRPAIRRRDPGRAAAAVEQLAADAEKAAKEKKKEQAPPLPARPLSEIKLPSTFAPVPRDVRLRPRGAGARALVKADDVGLSLAEPTTPENKGRSGEVQPSADLLLIDQLPWEHSIAWGDDDDDDEDEGRPGGRCFKPEEEDGSEDERARTSPRTESGLEEEVAAAAKTKRFTTVFDSAAARSEAGKWGSVAVVGDAERARELGRAALEAAKKKAKAASSSSMDVDEDEDFAADLENEFGEESDEEEEQTLQDQQQTLESARSEARPSASSAGASRSLCRNVLLLEGEWVASVIWDDDDHDGGDAMTAGGARRPPGSGLILDSQVAARAQPAAAAEVGPGVFGRFQQQNEAYYTGKHRSGTATGSVSRSGQTPAEQLQLVHSVPALSLQVSHGLQLQSIWRTPTAAVS